MVEVVNRSALDEQPGDGRRSEGAGGLPGVVLEERRPAAMAQINGAPGRDPMAKALGFLKLQTAPEPRQACLGHGVTLIWNGPGRWLAVSASALPEDFAASLRRALEPEGATVTDLSHARTIIRVAGPRVRDTLLKGCPLDLESFQVDECASTLLGHLNVQMHCAGERTFDVYVFRSFGLALWDWLHDAALEYGVDARSGE